MAKPELQLLVPSKINEVVPKRSPSISVWSPDLSFKLLRGPSPRTTHGVLSLIGLDSWSFLPFTPDPMSALHLATVA